MKNLLLIAFLTLFCIGCAKEFHLENPDVGTFVKQLKTGTYDQYEKGENGEVLWLLMPEFSRDHIQSLLDYSNDTSHIQEFPINPISSRRPFPEGRDYFILGECLLWTVEGIRNGYGYGSLDPFLIDTARTASKRYEGLTGAEIILVRDLYLDWWDDCKNSDWQNQNPLGKTSYRWF